MKQSKMAPKAWLGSLHKDKDFLQLASDLQEKSFNLFNAINASTFELRHSAFLSFLFDPKREHPFGSRFYQLLCRQQGILLPKQPRLEVSTEDERRDIIISDSANKVVIVIENKWGSVLMPHQTRTYSHVTERQFDSSWTKRYFLLSLKREKANDTRWKSVSYVQIAELIRRMTKGNRSMDSGLGLVLRHYIEIIDNRTMQEKDTKQIYAQHQAAFDVVSFQNIRTKAEAGLLKLLVNQSGLFSFDESIEKRRTRWIWCTYKIAEPLGVWVELQNDRSGDIWVSVGASREHSNGRMLLKHLRGLSDDNIVNFPVNSSGRNEQSECFYSEQLISGAEINIEERIGIIADKWLAFLRKRLPKIRKAIIEYKKRNKIN